MISFNGIKQVMDYVLKNHGQKQKVERFVDGDARLQIGIKFLLEKCLWAIISKTIPRQ